MANIGKINFDDGSKKYIINEDENNYIIFNPSDAALAARLKETVKVLSEKEKEEKAGKITAEELDKEVKRMIDYMLNAPVSEKVFRGANCLSPCLNGKQLYMNFLDSLAKELNTDIKAAIKKTSQNIESYTSKIIEE